ncbi:MAG: dethiobiotin synthase [Mucilaginibacter polytrichastri]|nr:dethiobiotin synthase [Mucilaginibacter polytrichastri]
MQRYFVSGIGTEIGKTIVSSVLVEKLKADYWKPVQSGDLENSDTDKVKRLISNTSSRFHAETYRLTQPFSPHKSARLDGISINLDAFRIPDTQNHLVIEGAGGLMVPLNDRNLMIDLIRKLDVEVILVSRHYLGSINHTLLSVEALRQRGIRLKGLIISGDRDPDSEAAIVKIGKVDVLGCVPRLPEINAENIAAAARTLDV